eukprot:4026157-Ditylum_brightwellii.AAC.1
MTTTLLGLLLATGWNWATTGMLNTAHSHARHTPGMTHNDKYMILYQPPDAPSQYVQTSCRENNTLQCTLPRTLANKPSDPPTPASFKEYVKSLSKWTQHLLRNLDFIWDEEDIQYMLGS